MFSTQSRIYCGPSSAKCKPMFRWRACARCRVYVVGDVQYPGAYDVSSLSTPLNALVRSRRPNFSRLAADIKHMRGNQLIEKIDIYDLLLHGVRSNMQRLEAGDTLLVPPIGRRSHNRRYGPASGNL